MNHLLFIRLALWVFLTASQSAAWAVDRYMATTGSDTNTCAQAEDSNTPKRTWDSIRTCMVPGDTTYIYSGSYNEYFRLTNMQGTDAVRFRIIGYGPTTPKFLAQRISTSSTNACRVLLTGSTSGIWVENLHFDGQGICSSGTLNNVTGNRMEGASYITWKNVEWSWMAGDHLITNSSNITYTGGSHHDAYSDCAPHGRSYAFYINKSATNIVVENLDLYGFPGGGIQVYPGTSDNITIRRNRIHHNSYCTTTPQGGITVFRDTLTSTGKITNVRIYDNVIYKNASPTGGRGHGIRIGGDIEGAKIYNNTVVYNENNSATGDLAYGIILQTSTCNGVTCVPINTEIKNNLVIGNEGGQISTAVGTGTVLAGNITTGVGSDYFVNAATDDYRLKQGTNAARDAGVAVSTRPSPVGAPDVGAFEQGAVTSASMAGAYLELVASVMTPGVLPVSAISGITIACGGGSPCTGSPVVSSANVKPGSNNVIQIVVSGITTPGTGTVSMGATNATDSQAIGGRDGTAQGLNSVSALSITGNVANTAGPAPPVGLWARFPLTEGSGTVANDSTGNGHHGTVSAGVTWVSDTSGTGVTIPNDATFRHVTSTYGTGVDPTAQDFAMCVYVRPSLTDNSQSVVFSAGGNGSSQRWYVGWATLSGQVQWGIGIRESGFFTGSEFVVSENLTLVCLTNDSAADTATLWVNGVKGTVVGKSVKTISASYTLVGNLRVGNDGTNTINNGGFTVYDILVWDIKPSDADLIALYGEVSPGGTSAGLSQSHVQWQHIYTTSGLSPVVLTPNGDGSINVVANGGIAPVVQYTCTGGACANIAPRLYFSTDGTNFTLPVPQALGVSGVAAWASSTDLYFNDGIVAGCVDATGLTSNAGVTVADAVAGQTFALANNHCRADRFPVRFGNVPDTSFWFRVKTDAGQDLATYSATIKVNVVPMQANMGF